jgi:hypothetical protein
LAENQLKPAKASAKTPNIPIPHLRISNIRLSVFSRTRNRSSTVSSFLCTGEFVGIGSGFDGSLVIVTDVQAKSEGKQLQS